MQFHNFCYSDSISYEFLILKGYRNVSSPSLSWAAWCVV